MLGLGLTSCPCIIQDVYVNIIIPASTSVSASVDHRMQITKNISDRYFGCMYSLSTIINCVWVYNYVFVFLLSRQSQRDEDMS